MRKLFYILFFSIFAQLLAAQQEQLYTQFMFNKLAINPAFAGHTGMSSVTAIGRNQWNGFPGAPETQLISMNLAIDQNSAAGLNLSRNTIGISEKLEIAGIYAYKLRFANSALSLGLQAAYRRIELDFTNPELFAINGFEDDPNISFNRMTQSVFNVGFGAYYSQGDFYVGVSAPRLLRPSLTFANEIESSREVRHLNIMIGGSIPLNDQIDLMPQFLYKWAELAPSDLDLNVSLRYLKKYYAGLSVRAGGDESSFAESIDFIFGFQITPKLMVAFAYDLSLSEIRNYENGSFEVLLNYHFQTNKPNVKPINPRYF